MFNKAHLELYCPFKGNATDYGKNGYTGIITGAVLANNNKGISNSAYSFTGASNRIDFGEACGDAITEALNNGATILFQLKFLAKSSGDYAYIVHREHSTSTNRSFYTDGYNNSGSNVFQYQQVDGTINPAFYSTGDSLTPGTWQNVKLLFTDNGSNMSVEMFSNGTSIGSLTSQPYMLETKTAPFRIGARDGDNTLGNFGEISNLMVFNRKITTTEEAYINQFGNYKRVA